MEVSDVQAVRLLSTVCKLWQDQPPLVKRSNERFNESIPVVLRVFFFVLKNTPSILKLLWF